MVPVRPPSLRPTRLVPAAVTTVAVTALAAACGAGSEREPAGQTLARQYGCLACHGDAGQGGTGPAWVGLYGSQVELEDGRTVTVDEEYLRRSVIDPNADVPKGSTLPMPVNPQVTEADLDEIIAWIISLADQ